MTAVPLCRAGGRTCAACCFGPDVPPARLRSALRRHTRLFARQPRDCPPGRWQLLRHELAARRGLDLVWAVSLLLPGVGDLLHAWLGRRLVCAFLGFEDAAETRAGCLLHPSRWAGRDVRQTAAFALLRGIGCGTPDHLCLPALLYARASHRARAAFARATAGLDWYAFSLAASAFHPAHPAAKLAAAEACSRRGGG